MATDPASRLRDHGVLVTAQRLAVLRAVSSHPHCTAEEVAEHARAEIGTISRQAVYDALGILADNGLIRRIQPAGSPALYEGRVGDNHHHLICRTCGKTADVDCTVGNACAANVFAQKVRAKEPRSSRAGSTSMTHAGRSGVPLMIISRRYGATKLNKALPNPVNR